MLRNPGTKDSSNPIAINGRFKGKHQCFVVQLANIGLIQKVFLDNIHDIQVAFLIDDIFKVEFISSDWIDQDHP